MRELPDQEAPEATSTDQIRAYYRHFAEVEAAVVSPKYARWAAGVATDDAMLERLMELPAGKRQANLLFAAARIHGVEADAWSQARELVLSQWTSISTTMLNRATQTNEPGRVATLNLAFDRIQAESQQPLALIEVGSSAGLCLYPDVWPTRYIREGEPDVYLNPPSGALRSTVELECSLSELQPPQALPRVGYRAGIELNPLDITKSEDLHWLEALVWPGMENRVPRLSAGAKVLSQDPPETFAGDLNERLAEVLAQVPAGMTPVVFHTAVLAYLNRQDRRRFQDQVLDAGVRWVSNEGINVVEGIAEQLPQETDSETGFILSLDGEPLARTAPHGQSARALRR